MKIIKTILLLTIISVLTSVPYSIAEARDCSDPKGFHQKLMCKKLFKNLEWKSDSSEETITAEPEEKKSGVGGLWQKIKNFGGKKVGEPG